MPLIENPSYNPKGLFKFPHFNTIVSNKFRRVPKINFERERVELPDGDFMDIDWVLPKKNSTNNLAIILPGLEGKTSKTYMRGMFSIFQKNGFDCVGMNHRGCSGEDNRLLRAYHTGFTDDLRFMVQKIISETHYDNIVLIGFSLGGNIVMKYAGEQAGLINPRIKKVIAFSVPCHLPSSVLHFEQPFNKVYLTNFFMTLKPKAKLKNKKFPGVLNMEKILSAKLFREFDEHFTAPTNGFKSALDYYTQASSLPYLEKITIPTMLIIAQDDSFVSPESIPYELAQKSKTFFLQAPIKGGHCGFLPNDTEGYLWTEREAIRFALINL